MSGQKKYNPWQAFRQWLKQWGDFDYYARNLSYILFLSFLALVYIWNRHSAERNIMRMNRLKNQLTELHWQYTTSKSQLNRKSMESEVVRLVEPLGLRSLTSPPEIINPDEDGD